MVDSALEEDQQSAQRWGVSGCHQQRPAGRPTYALSCWKDVLMRLISWASRWLRTLCATASVCRAFTQRGIRSRSDW